MVDVGHLHPQLTLKVYLQSLDGLLRHSQNKSYCLALTISRAWDVVVVKCHALSLSWNPSAREKSQPKSLTLTRQVVEELPLAKAQALQVLRFRVTRTFRQTKRKWQLGSRATDQLRLAHMQTHGNNTRAAFLQAVVQVRLTTLSSLLGMGPNQDKITG